MSNKKDIATVTLKVKEKKNITPNFIRIILTGEAEDIEVYKDSPIGVNNKIYVPPVGATSIEFPEFDFENGKWILPPKEVCPAIRTYTHRGIDLEKKELIIDFAAHGEEGPASTWAINAKPGDLLGVSMHTLPKELYPEADWYLLVGDATAIPVLAVILETLPKTAKGVAIIEVHGKEDEQELFTKADIEFHWIHNPNPQKGSNLAEITRRVKIPAKETTSRFGYVAAEFSTIKGIRHYLRKELEWTKEELYAYSYWKAGVSEDGSVADRHNEREDFDKN
ncbi:siderophore-interacting protein [Flavobacterium sp. '19STA2R22 D10 B1']|uniref:siderophore-interacting protein n=1 Tax=Flavobacterium aerium TaxID=3037261 RepID=UPI00278C7447|nr:siderophore-interacting protein [Flavobacterium sp. '19STA2R22 D10 B1']